MVVVTQDDPDVQLVAQSAPVQNGSQKQYPLFVHTLGGGGRKSLLGVSNLNGTRHLSLQFQVNQSTEIQKEEKSRSTETCNSRKIGW